MVKKQRSRIRKKSSRPTQYGARSRNIEQLNVMASNINTLLTRSYKMLTQINNLAAIICESDGGYSDDDKNRARTSVAILYEKLERAETDIKEEINRCRRQMLTVSDDNYSLEVINITSKIDDWTNGTYTEVVDDMGSAEQYLRNIIGA